MTLKRVLIVIAITIVSLSLSCLIQGHETIDTILTDSGIIENTDGIENAGSWGYTFISTTKNGTMTLFDNTLYNIAIKRSGEKVNVTIMEKAKIKDDEIVSRKFKLMKVEFIESGTSWVAKGKMIKEVK